MADISSAKKALSKKLLNFQKNGLEQYAKYLGDQLKMAGDKKSKAAYKKYIEQQIAATDKKIKSIGAKLKSL